MAINVNRTLDVGVCLDILVNQEIFNAISEDGATINSLKVDVINDYWLTITNEQDLIGVVQFKQIYNKCYDSHIHILPEHRGLSREAGKEILNWCNKNMKGSLLYTAVPEFCDNVKQYLLSFNFIEIGVLPKAWLKNGQQNDMTILTRII